VWQLDLNWLPLTARERAQLFRNIESNKLEEKPDLLLSLKLLIDRISIHDAHHLLTFCPLPTTGNQRSTILSLSLSFSLAELLTAYYIQ